MTTLKVNYLCPIYSDKAKTLTLENPVECGTSSDYVTTSTVDKKFLQYYIENTAATGDNRAMYLRLKLSGGSGGESLRVFTNVEANAGTAHGAHISLNFKATAGGSECSGTGAAIRGTLQIPDVASWAPTGTYTAGMFEIYSDGTASDPAGMTTLSVLQLSNSGNATGKADVDTDAVLLSIQGFTSAADTTKVFTSVRLAELPANTVGMRCKIGSAIYYLPFVAEGDWD